MTNFWSLNNVVGLILAIIGVAWLIYSIIEISRQEAVERWPKTIGTVVSSAIEEPVTVNQTPSAVLNPDVRLYTPYVLYQYTVNDVKYESNTFYLAYKRKFNGIEIQKMMESYRKGDPITIHYNPNNVSESYIYGGIKSYFGIFWSVILILIALALGFQHNIVYIKKNQRIVIDN